MSPVVGMAGLPSALLLGLLQGITEFLPVSSSGHLAAVQLLWPNLAYPGLTMEIVLHVGTTLAVVAYHSNIIRALLRPDGAGDIDALGGLSVRRWWCTLIVASVPTAIIGLVGTKLIHLAFQRLSWVAVGLAVTGCVLMLSKFLQPRSICGMNFWRALAIGTAQGLAIWPGVSRSGTTISVALMLGVQRRQAVVFSLLLSIPAVMGATLLDALELLAAPTPPALLFVNLAFATLVALVVGYACIGLLHRVTQAQRWHLFAWYCWPLAAFLAVAAR